MATPDPWSDVVSFITGYILPDRSTLFETLKGNDDTRLMKFEITKISEDDFTSANIGWRVDNTDYVIPFAQETGGGLSYHAARLSFLGTSVTKDPSTGEDIVSIPMGPREGRSFGSKYKNHLGLDNPTWDTSKLYQYIYGSGRALQELLFEGTGGFSFSGASVLPADQVDLTTFDRAGSAFDRVARFFHQGSAQLNRWEESLGKEDAAWLGQAAGVFRDLVHRLNRDYERFSEALRVTNGRSMHAKKLQTAKDELYRSASLMLNAWNNWNIPEGHPLYWLDKLIREIIRHVMRTNHRNLRPEVVTEYQATPMGLQARHNVENVLVAGFSHNAVDERGRDHGPLHEPRTWKAISDAAIADWEEYADQWLGEAAREAKASIFNVWNNIGEFPSLEMRPFNLYQEYVKDKNERDQLDAKKQQDDLNARYEKDKQEADKKADEQEAKYEKDKQDAERKAAEQEAKYEKDRLASEEEAKRKEAEQLARYEKDKQEAERLRAEQEREAAHLRAEQKREADEMRAEEERRYAYQLAERERQEAEANARYEEEKKEAERKEAEAKAEADRREQEAKAEAERQEAEAKAEADRQEALAARQMAESRALSEQDRADQRRKEKEQLARYEEDKREAERLRVEQESKAEQQQAEREREAAYLRAEQKREADEMRAEEERRYAYQLAERERQEAEANARYEEEKKEAERKEAEAKAEADRREQEAKAEAERKEAEAKAEADRREQEAKAEAERQEAEANARYEEEKEEAERKENEAKQESDRLERKAQEEADRRTEEMARRDAEARAQFEGLQNRPDLPYSPPPSLVSDPFSGTGEGIPKINDDGTVTFAYPDGTSTTLDPNANTVATLDTGGLVDTDALRNGDLIYNPDGSVSSLNDDGSVVTDYPDGRSTIVDPDEGTITQIAPDGSTTTTPLESSSNHRGWNTSETFPYEEELYDPYSDPLSGPASLNRGGLGGADGQPQGTGPMSPGMMPPRLGGGVGDDSAGERNRSVMNSDIVSNRNGRQQNPAAMYQDEVGIPQRSGTTGSMMPPMMPPMGGMPAQQNGNDSGDRARTAWVPEDEDVWGIDEGGAPTVIGR